MIYFHAPLTFKAKIVSFMQKEKKVEINFLHWIFFRIFFVSKSKKWKSEINEKVQCHLLIKLAFLITNVVCVKI